LMKERILVPNTFIASQARRSDALSESRMP
jgi:hypothetical protein